MGQQFLNEDEVIFYLQGLRLILGPKIDCPEFVVELKIKALGEVTATMTQFKFDGELRVSLYLYVDLL